MDARKTVHSTAGQKKALWQQGAFFILLFGDVNQSSLFPERTDRVPARFTVETESSMPHLGELSSPDLFSGEHPREKEVEDRDLMIHAAGGNAEDGDRGRGQGAECRI
jgi:hypothetical protein